MPETVMMTLSGVTENQVEEIAGAFARTSGRPVSYAFNDKSRHAHIAITVDDYKNIWLEPTDNNSEHITRYLRKEPRGMKTILP